MALYSLLGVAYCLGQTSQGIQLDKGNLLRLCMAFFQKYGGLLGDKFNFVIIIMSSFLS